MMKPKSDGPDWEERLETYWQATAAVEREMVSESEAAWDQGDEHQTSADRELHSSTFPVYLLETTWHLPVAAMAWSEEDPNEDPEEGDIGSNEEKFETALFFVTIRRKGVAVSTRLQPKHIDGNSLIRFAISSTDRAAVEYPVPKPRGVSEFFIATISPKSPLTCEMTLGSPLGTEVVVLDLACRFREIGRTDP